MKTYVIDRTAPLPPTARGQCHAGAAERDITPPLGFSTAGYSVDGRAGRGVLGHLFARALVLEDIRGLRSAFVVTDTHCASRYVLETVAARVGPSCGISVDRLVLCGTHTHTGPGNLYGNSLYDSMAQATQGFDETWANWVASRIADAVEAATVALQPARIGVGRSELWGISQNRSLTAFLQNVESQDWNAPGSPGGSAPANLGVDVAMGDVEGTENDRRHAVSPRVVALGAWRTDGTDSAIGVLGLFACHSTTLGLEDPVYSADWPGWAVETMREALGPGVIVACANGAAGDVNGLRRELDSRREVLARTVGAAVGRAVVDAAATAKLSAASTLTIDSWFVECDTRDKTIGGSTATTLARRWAVGTPVLGGAEDGRTTFWKIGLAREGMRSTTDFAADAPQIPKKSLPGAIQFIADHLLGVEAPPILPMHVVRMGSSAFVTVPGEPTVVAGLRIERIAQAMLSGVTDVAVIGYAGDYSGYFTTPEEFDVQDYEGAHTLWGKWSVPHLIACMSGALIGAPNTPPAPGPVGFDTVPVNIFAPNLLDERQRIEPLQSEVVRDPSGVAILRWRMPRVSSIGFAMGPVVQIERRVAGQREVVVFGNAPLDDRRPWIRVSQVDQPRHEALDLDHVFWQAVITLPDAVQGDLSVRLRANDRDVLLPIVDGN